MGPSPGLWLRDQRRDRVYSRVVVKKTKGEMGPPQGLWLKSRRLVLKKNCFSAWASTLNMGLINKVDMVCLSPVGYGV